MELVDMPADNENTNCASKDRHVSFSDGTILKSQSLFAAFCESNWKKYFNLKKIKIVVLSTICISAAIIFFVMEKSKETDHFFAVNSNAPYSINVTDKMNCGYMEINLLGSFHLDAEYLSHSEELDSYIEVFLTISPLSNKSITSRKRIYIYNDRNNSVERISRHFDISNINKTASHDFFLTIISNIEKNVALEIEMQDSGASGHIEVLCAIIILLFLYFLIITEIVHRTVAALLCALLAIATLSYLKEGPTLEEVIEWIDWETLLLLTGMMLLVAIFADSGFFDVSAITAYKIARGNEWLLMLLLCVFAAATSAFLDNVTTMLLMTPVTIRLSGALKIDAKYVLIAEILMSNIGGAATAIGDPPNVLIVSNRQVQLLGVDFMSFTKRMFFGSMACAVMGLITIRVIYSLINISSKEDPALQEYKDAIRWVRRSSIRISETEHVQVSQHIQSYMTDLNTKLQETMKSTEKSPTDRSKYIEKLEKECYIKSYKLLAKSGVILTCVILLFFIESTSIIHTQLGWIAGVGALVLIVLADIEDLDSVLHKVEWSTLTFFAALFVLMHALEKLHLISFIGDHTQTFIEHLENDFRFPVALFIVLWVSALSSSFIDNIPFTTAMIPIVIKLGELPNIHVKPLLWALSFGACLGGNGTLIGASANLVCAGVAEQKGCKISFIDFFKVGFPVMLSTVFIAMLYLFIFHIYPFGITD